MMNPGHWSHIGIVKNDKEVKMYMNGQHIETKYLKANGI